MALLCGSHHQERSGQGKGLDGRKFTSHISLLRIELMVEGILRTLQPTTYILLYYSPLNLHVSYTTVFPACHYNV